MLNVTTSNANAFPSPTGVTYYEYECSLSDFGEAIAEFPSPTGVTYYEY